MKHQEKRTARMWRGVAVVLAAGFLMLGATPAAVASEWRISFGAPYRYHSDYHGAGHYDESGCHHGVRHHAHPYYAAGSITPGTTVTEGSIAPGTTATVIVMA